MAGAEGVDTGGRLGGLRSGDDDEDEKRDERQHLTNELDAWVLQDPYHLKINTKKPRVMANLMPITLSM